MLSFSHLLYIGPQYSLQGFETALDGFPNVVRKMQSTALWEDYVHFDNKVVANVVAFHIGNLEDWVESSDEV